MRRILLVFMAAALFACNSQTNPKTDPAINAEAVKVIPDCNVALKFINDYVALLTHLPSAVNEDDWVAHNSLLTDNFKTTYKDLLDSAQKADPELGLDFDPILDAQDFPDKGFELVNCDNETGYVDVKGKELNDFTLVLKLVRQNNKWLVDGSGVLNIPVGKRRKR